jgi:hypothetical protein
MACQVASQPGYADKRTKSSSIFENAISAVIQFLQNAGAATIQEWKQYLGRLRSAGYLNDGSPDIRSLEGFLISLEDEPKTSQVAILQWCLEAPVQSIGLLIPALEAGEAAIRKLADHVSAYLDLNAGTGPSSIEGVHTIGDRLSNVAKDILPAVRANHE